MKDKRKVLKIVVCILFLFIIFMNVNQNIFAAVNTSYGDNSNVVEPDLDKKVKNSTILNAVGSFIYAIASMIEFLVGVVFQGLTGVNMFPWADKVIFNTVPLLDVNFLNPDHNSLFYTSGTPSMIYNIVRNTYFTVLSLAIAFLGIIVGIMAIRLAVSAIASEKAKYKEAISNWLLAIVLLFTMHYALSFMFFANEKMVEVASGVLTQQIKDSKIESKLEQLSTIDDDKELVTVFIDTQKKIKVSDIISPVIGGIQGISKTASLFFENAKDWVSDNTKEDYLKDDKNTRIAAFLLNSTTYKSERILYADGNANRSIWQSVKQGFSNYFSFTNLGVKAIDILYDDVKSVQSQGADAQATDVKAYFENEFTDDTSLSNIMYQAWKCYVKKGSTGQSGATSATNIIAEMGQYFKKAAWSIPTNASGKKTGWSATNVSLQGAILYAVFVVQSMMFFFAYMKRFFYVIILSMLAPIVIIYDFFTKSIA